MINYFLCQNIDRQKISKKKRHFLMPFHKNRLLKTKDGEDGLNYLCAGLYAFYEHIQPDLAHIHQSFKAHQNS